MKTGSRPPGQADVAKKAGVSISTVSLALRNDARIPLVTQQRVRKAAKALNYRPDPILAALVARRDQGRTRRTYSNIAALVDDRWLSSGTWPGWHTACMRGMQAGCERLGYSLDAIHIARDLMAARNPDRLLNSRGIRGVVLMPLANHEVKPALEWERYSAIALGNPPDALPLHRVGGDAFAAMSIACQHLAALGYRRLGLAHSKEAEKRMRYEWAGSFSKESLLESGLQLIPPYLPDDWNAADFLRWVDKSAPDCVITNHALVVTWLESGGWKIPRDIGVALLTSNFSVLPNVSGVAQHLEVTGEAAIEQLHTLLLRGETGFPAVPKEILIRPHWQEGRTLRTEKK